MRKFLVALTFMLYSSVTLAGHCPADAKAIDAGLSKVTLSDEIRAQVTALKDKGMSEHSAGDHGSSEKTLAEAMRMLLTNIE